MPANPCLWDFATNDILGSIAESTNELSEGAVTPRHQIDEFTAGCKSMAHWGTILRNGSEIDGHDAVSHWNDLYTALGQSLIPSMDDSEPGCTCPGEYLDSQLQSLKMITDKSMAAEPLWVNKIATSLKETAIAARETASTALVRDSEALLSKHAGTCTVDEGERLRQLSYAANEYADRATQINGPAVEIIETGIGEVHDLLEHDDASQFMCEMSYALQITELDTLAQFRSLDMEDVNKIRASVIAIQEETSNILAADLEIEKTGKRLYYGQTPRIYIDDEEYQTARILYNRAVAAERRRQKSLPWGKG